MNICTVMLKNFVPRSLRKQQLKLLLLYPTAKEAKDVETHIWRTCVGKWDEPVLNTIRDWMANKIVPWMLMPFARGAKNCKDSDIPGTVS